MSIIPPDPTTFFEKTTKYASQGRGLFQIMRYPQMFATEDLPDTVHAGFNLLRRGLVASVITLPPRSLGTYEPISFSGPTRTHAYNQILSDITVEFLLMGNTADEAKSIYHTFAYWHERIAGPNDLGPDRLQYPPHSDITAFNTEYYDNYITDAEVRVFGATHTDGALIRMQYFDLYPLEIGATQLAWSAPDAPISLSVTFTYYYSRSTPE